MRNFQRHEMELEIPRVPMCPVPLCVCVGGGHGTFIFERSGGGAIESSEVH